ncbi:MAG: hypothetical protein KF691_05360 [Phycisphaeraceae bacterium]|nr:hypothetical protein [Phycisphaeraceae bacterium]
MSETRAPASRFLPDPVKPGPFGLRYTVLDHRGMRRPLASATWAERVAHAPNAGRFLPKFPMSASTIGLILLVVAATFAMQDAGSRLAATFSPGSSVAKTAIQLLGLFGPLLFTVVLLLAGLVFSASRIWMPAVARYWLSIGQCASCRYDLARVEPAPDEYVVCPECGAAWRISRERSENPTSSSEPPTSVGAVQDHRR